MVRLIAFILIISSFLAADLLMAGETSKAPHVAFASKYRNVDYLFTERAESAAVADGANYDFAIREVGWDLISAVGRACSSVKNIQAIFIDRINFKERHSFIVLGVLSDLQYLSLNIDEALSNATLKELITAFEREHVSVIRLAEATGVELSLSTK